MDPTWWCSLPTITTGFDQAASAWVSAWETTTIRPLHDVCDIVADAVEDTLYLAWQGETVGDVAKPRPPRHHRPPPEPVPRAEVVPAADRGFEDVVTIGTYTRRERRALIARFKQKKLRRSKPFEGYACRRISANRRPRVGGRFVKSA